ncbi:HlyD family secretion protein [Streptococcus sp. NLN64]|uniref:HlyD family secretion protein n=1 Tax=Streptococcus sp. NLN64 TaxID=2822799 RepID=UPI0018C9CFAB|nr:HlyD family secretion protein [Streptococcus sp. NLN64]MBG9367350.1 HlyD family secretion protein [Streptococcus sp. NLN64]
MSSDYQSKIIERRRKERRNLGILIGILALLLTLFFSLDFLEKGKNSFIAPFLSFFQPKERPQPRYGKGDQVLYRIEDEEIIGRVLKSSETKEGGFVYEIELELGVHRDQIPEDQLEGYATLYQLGDQADLAPSSSLEGSGEITKINRVGNQIVYEASVENLGRVYDIKEDELKTTLMVDLKTENSREENNVIFRQALEKASDNAFTILDFPEGEFQMGVDDPAKDYFTLPSNVQLRGNETTLVVDGGMFWFGFATGPGGTEGLSNFIMENLHIRAKDLENGNQFMLMANHGYNWRVRNNEFTMVHKMSSHIFDLGGVQYAAFTGNTFSGYAPNLTNLSNLPEDGDYHKIYAEAIQVDASNNSGVWDGYYLRNTDPNYAANNMETVLSSGITIRNNSFLPYKDDAGKIIAYGATVGQHSSKVGYVTVADNLFQSTLSTRFGPIGDDKWVLRPVHFPLDSSTVTEYGNKIES